MSHKATNWAVEASKGKGLRATAKVVLWHLCDRFNPDNGCFVSQERLAEDAEMSRSALNDQLDALEKAGLIRRIQRRDKGTKRQKSTIYLFAFQPEFGDGSDAETVAENGKSRVRNSDTEKAKAVSDFSQKPCPKNGESRVRNSDSNPVREPVREPARARGDAAPDGASPTGAQPGAAGGGGSGADTAQGSRAQDQGSAGRAREAGCEPVPTDLRWRVRDLVIQWVLNGGVARHDAMRLVYGVPVKGGEPVPGLSVFQRYRLPPNDLNPAESAEFVRAVPVTVRREVVSQINWVKRWIAGEDQKAPTAPFKALEDSLRRYPETPRRDERIATLMLGIDEDVNQQTEKEAVYGK